METHPKTTATPPLTIDRRTALRAAMLGTAAAASGLALTSAACGDTGGAQDAKASAAGFTLPELPYATDALEPVIGKRIMELHHGKHHAGYVSKLNAALEAHPELAKRDVEALLRDLDGVPESARQAVRNHGGGHANHAMFWQIMGPPRDAKPSGELAEAIDSTFGDLGRFREAFQKAGGGVFGSGWVWLTLARDGKLAVESTPNQDSPLSAGREVVMGNDVWEHAYYLTYENRRAEYLEAWWKVVNWDAVTARYSTAKARFED